MSKERDCAPLSTEISPPKSEVDLTPSVCWTSGVEVEHVLRTDEAAGDWLTIGQMLSGRYRIERELGEGGMGVVYLVTDEQVIGETFAVKVLKEGLDPQSLQLLREEVRKTRKLSHPNIVDMHSVNVDGSRVYVLMESLEGKSLNALLDEEFGRGMPFSHAWPIIEDVGAALGNAHDHNVIHSDLKPANVFVTNSGRTKLLDFGIARVSRGPLLQKWSGTRALTPAYASCEMLKGEEADTRDDIYSFACVIYEMLSGRRPFGELTALEAREAGAQVPPLAVLSQPQNEALAQALAFDRAARTSSVESLLSGLRADVAPRAHPTPAVVAGIIAATAAAVGLTYFALDKLWLSRHSVMVQSQTSSAQQAASPATTSATFNPPPHSIAVLPFVDMSEKKDQEYIGDGMAEEILNLLAKIPDLKVIGRTSSFQFKGKTEDLRKIGMTLDAAYAVEGSVRRSGDHVRVTAQLIDTRDGTHRWSDTYDTQFDDVLKVQDAIAGSVARALQIAVGDVQIPARQAVSPAAYDLFLKGMHAFDTNTQEGCEEAIGFFTQALRLDPKFAPAVAGMAWAYEYIGEQGWLPTTKEAFDRARENALRALELDPKLSAAHTVLANVHLVYDWDWAAAQHEIDTAFALGGRDAAGLSTAARIVSATDPDSPNAPSLLHEAIALDPLDAEAYVSLGVFVYYRTGHFVEAERSIRRALQIRPQFGSGHYFLALSLLMQGRLDEALAEAKQETLTDGQLESSAAIYYAQHRKAESDAAMTRSIATNANTWASAIAKTLAFRGDSEKALQWLERSYAQRDEDLYFLKGDPLLHSLESDPRYKALLRKMNLPE